MPVAEDVAFDGQHLLGGGNRFGQLAGLAELLRFGTEAVAFLEPLFLGGSQRRRFRFIAPEIGRKKAQKAQKGRNKWH